MMGYIFLGLVMLLLVIGVSIYNRLVKNRNLVQEAWSGIDVQLKRRADLIPNLLEAVKGYMGHERGVLDRVTELRTQSRQAGQCGRKSAGRRSAGGGPGESFGGSRKLPGSESFPEFSGITKIFGRHRGTIAVGPPLLQRRGAQSQHSDRLFPQQPHRRSDLIFSRWNILNWNHPRTGRSLKSAFRGIRT